MMKNVFYFVFKVFSFSTYLNFCLDFFGHVGKWLNKKAKVIFKIYDATYRVTMHILVKISRSRVNQTMKFCQSI